MRTGFLAFKEEIKQKYLMNEHRIKEIEELLETGHNMEAVWISQQRVICFCETVRQHHYLTLVRRLSPAMRKLRRVDSARRTMSFCMALTRRTSSHGPVMISTRRSKNGNGLSSSCSRRMHGLHRLMLNAEKMRDVHRELQKRALEGDEVALDANGSTKVFKYLTEWK
jgi:hypothetical protein